MRTWTFVANRPDWLADPAHWQAVARSVEDRLSDALHERLTERFVDRRTSVLMRRLRENTALETEIKKSGEVVVEGHVIGRLDGFTFAADTSEGGSDAKALQAAARSALAGEIDARAIKLTQAPERELVLDSEGAVRWIGSAVGKLIAGDDVLRPRVRLIADEQLTGASRETVQTRLDHWLKNHIERLLGPLFALAAAEDVTGMARGVAYQLIEALGVLERQKVAEDVKGLDQPSRGTLRKYGVRFGAYHLYMPALLKPAPRSLAAQLWMLKHGGPEAKGLDDLQRLAASGRTSIPVDKDAPKPLYRSIGYRVCGERAIRVDILERLADLIRPALAWREGGSGTKPAGAFNGFGFTVTGAMTSLTGASGEDFASILRSLGYRVEKRPKPKDEAAAAATPTPSATAEAPADAAPAAEVTETAEHAPTLAPDAEPPAAAADEPQSLAEPAAVETAAPEQATNADAKASVQLETAAAAPAEPDMIEVWRPGRPAGERKKREGERRPRRRSQRPAATPEVSATAEGAAAAPAEPGAAAAGAEAQPSGEPQPDHRGRPRHRRRDGEQKDGAERKAERSDRQNKRDRATRSDRRDRPEGRPPRRDRDRDRRDDNRPDRIWASSQEPRGNKEPDPNSPFAKLLALKEQLTNKER